MGFWMFYVKIVPFEHADDGKEGQEGMKFAQVPFPTPVLPELGREVNKRLFSAPALPGLGGEKVYKIFTELTLGRILFKILLTQTWRMRECQKIRIWILITFPGSV